MPVLAETLQQGEQWERLLAANVLDEIDQDAEPILPTIRAALQPRAELYANGKYTVRVVNRLLNELLGTTGTVP